MRDSGTLPVCCVTVDYDEDRRLADTLLGGRQSLPRLVLYRPAGVIDGGTNEAAIRSLLGRSSEGPAESP